MNDRFKFRVWDKYNEVYFGGSYGVSYYLTDPEIDGDLYCFQCDGPFELSKDDEFVVEQCTGLKDKNGKLIYEGDILKTLDGRICWVIWMGTSFWLKSPGSEAKDWEYDSFYEHCEVIGNIHENKELLND